MDIYASLVDRIIKEQTSIIGPLALSQAKKVEGISFSGENSITIKGEPKHVVEELVRQYEHLFGNASIEVCKDAVKEITPAVSEEMLPDILK